MLCLCAQRLTCSRPHVLESSEFSTIWLRLNNHSLTKFICVAYFSTNSCDYSKFFDYLTSKVEHILFPFLGLSMFIPSFGFPLPSLTILVN
ncbi:hypothetical protein E2C01_026784 [Portunus trituberculatus]|uniref:Uncharacterized protein n=1 Tax=Portunus trituberculatus TaxID=210409 RepID=A0A5B7ELY5_PORTR|nr:hypothetical protein [Portunus trituberculatus]